MGRRWSSWERYTRPEEKWFAQLLRERRGDLLQRVAFEEDTITKGRGWKRRVGRPRIAWIDQAREQVWSSVRAFHAPALNHTSFDHDNQDHVNKIYKAVEAGAI